MKCYNMNDEKIIEILKDIECPQDTIAKYVDYGTKDNLCEQIRLLRIHRCLLLENIHHQQKKIDSLDYLLYYMKNKCQ